jgi:hypothetical protein
MRKILWQDMEKSFSDYVNGSDRFLQKAMYSKGV